jgi:peptidoglycan/LPS O-acetylase OafA/YrhL
VVAHAVAYRFATISHLHYEQKLAEPLAQTSVQIFFVISGYIITSLLLKERLRTGHISVPAFYIRRVCRIIPPLAAVLLVLALFGWSDLPSLAMASTFTCNIGDCHWWTAHTWSLSVEEQYYLVWPMLLVAFNPRPRAILGAIVLLLLGFLVAPWAFHSNYVSFACIGIGALYASSARFREWIRPNQFAWLAVVTFLVFAPLYLPAKAAVVTPFMIVYLLFATPAWAKSILAVKPVQMIGIASYSLYLWQQLFLAKNDSLPIWGLPLVVAASVVLIEQPFIRLGKRVSMRLLAPHAPEVAAQGQSVG